MKITNKKGKGRGSGTAAKDVEERFFGDDVRDGFGIVTRVTRGVVTVVRNNNHIGYGWWRAVMSVVVSVVIMLVLVVMS